MSTSERAEFIALAELEQVVERVTDELAAFRARALKAEAERAEVASTPDLVSARERLGDLERENRDLQQRVEYARERVGNLLARLEFLGAQMSSDHGTSA